MTRPQHPNYLLDRFTRDTRVPALTAPDLFEAPAIPRTWNSPGVPVDVQDVADRHGQTWKRDPELPGASPSPRDTWVNAGGSRLDWYRLVGIRGPLTEMAPPEPAPTQPHKVVLCGSTRFSDTFREANLRETLAGKIVLTIGCDMHTDAELFADKTPEQLAAIKADLDELHKRKIDLADECLVLNVGGYIGASTRSEIVYAAAAGKPVRYLEPDSAPVAGDTYNNWTIDAYKIPGNTQDYRVVLSHDGTPIREWEYPAYKIWTLLAHWRENDEVQAALGTGQTFTTPVHPPTDVERTER